MKISLWYILFCVAMMGFPPPRVLAADYEGIGITGANIAEFFNSMHSAAASANPSDLCELLAYPIEIGRRAEGIIVSIANKNECIAKHNVIFTAEILRDMKDISDSDVVEIKSMLMAYGGDLWISKYYIGEFPLEISPNRMNFTNKSAWSMKIVQLNVR